MRVLHSEEVFVTSLVCFVGNCRLRQRRIERRKSQKEFKRHRMKEKRANEKAGRPGDVDFQRMIRKFRNDGLPERMKVRLAVAVHFTALG